MLHGVATALVFFVCAVLGYACNSSFTTSVAGLFWMATFVIGVAIMLDVKCKELLTNLSNIAIGVTKFSRR